MHRWLGFWAIFWGAFLLRIRVRRPRRDHLEFYAYRKQWNHDIARAFHFIFQDSGPRPAAGTLIVSNHAGFEDINAIVCTLPAETLPNFISKIEIGNLPIFGWHMAIYGDVLFDRNNQDERQTVPARAMARLKKGFSIVLFPEGTRSKDGSPQEKIRPALIELAIAEKIPIQPVAVRNTFLLLEKPRSMAAHTEIPIRYGAIRSDYSSAQEVWRDVIALWNGRA